MKPHPQAENVIAADVAGDVIQALRVAVAGLRFVERREGAGAVALEKGALGSDDVAPLVGTALEMQMPESVVA
jgi:hypothetical protein